MSKPNIIFYFSDQQRADTCGCYGQELNITPNLDSLAQEGVLFESSFTPQPVCGPCRAVFQTGLYPTSTGCFRNNKALPLDCKTVANYFTEAGYETAYIGKWHLASDGELEQKPTIDFTYSPIPLERRGGYNGYWRASDVLEFTSNGFGGYIFDENMNKIEFDGYRADCITDFALDFLNVRDNNKPFFMTISHIEPHHQNDAHHYQGPKGSKEKFKNFTIPGDLKGSDGDYMEEYPDYLGACESVDRNLGRLIQTLKDQNLYDNTIIVYSSDHGSHFRTRNKDNNLNGFDDYKRSGHDSCLRVPLVISGGAYKGGKIVKELVSTASIPKTLLAMADIKETSPMIGEDLLTVVDGSTNRNNDVFAQISESRVGRIIRTEKYTYGVYAPGKNGGVYSESNEYKDDYLYDLDKDPDQKINLINDSAYLEIKKMLRVKLVERISEAEYNGDTSKVRII